MSKKKKFATLYKSSRYSAVKGRAQEVQRRAAQFSQITRGRNTHQIGGLLLRFAYTAVCATPIRFSPSPTVLQSTRAFSSSPTIYWYLFRQPSIKTQLFHTSVFGSSWCATAILLYIAHLYSAIFRVCCFSFHAVVITCLTQSASAFDSPTRSIKLVD